MSWVVLLAAAVAVLGAIGVVRSRIPVHSVLALVLNLLALAALFIALNAEFMGLVQIIVYAGAVMVLFLFVVSLLGPRREAIERELSLLPGQEPLGVAMGVLFFIALLVAVVRQAFPAPQAVHGGFGTVRAFGAALFYEHVLVLQLAALLLMVAVVGVVVLIARREQGR